MPLHPLAQMHQFTLNTTDWRKREKLNTCAMVDMCLKYSESTAEKLIRGWGGKKRLPGEENTASGELDQDEKTFRRRGQQGQGCGALQQHYGLEVKPGDWEEVGERTGQIMGA